MDVSECEYCGLTHGAANGLGLRSYMADLGFEMSLEMLSDSSAARVRIPTWLRTPKTRANTISVASGTSGSQTSLDAEDQNHTQHCGDSHKGSKQRNIGTAQENNWIETCQRTQQAEGTQT